MTPLPVTFVLRDALARVTRALDALADGDYRFGEQVLEDLAIDLQAQVEAAARRESSQ